VRAKFGVKEEANSRDNVKHIDKNYQLFVEKMMQVDEQVISDEERVLLGG